MIWHFDARNSTLLVIFILVIFIAFALVFLPQTMLCCYLVSYYLFIPGKKSMKM
jgi:hypothetical protein